MAHFTAVAVAKAGRSVRVVDLDPQASLTAWANPQRDGYDLGDGEADFIISDTPPNLEHPEVHRAIAESDTVVVCASPSPADVGAVRATLEAIRHHRKRRGAKVLVVLNQGKKGTMLTEAAGDALRELGEPVAATIIPQRQAIQKALLVGWSGLGSEEREAFFRLALEIIS